MSESGNKVPISVFWFRRDLRLQDNAGLFFALKENQAVLPIFIFDTQILSKLENKYDRRVDYIHRAILKIKAQLKSLNSDVKIFHSTAESAFKQLKKEYFIQSVYCNHDYEPAAIERDSLVEQILKKDGISFKTYKDQCVFDKHEVVKDDGKPYTVFTPYSKKWKSKLNENHYAAYPTENYFSRFLKLKYTELEKLESFGFQTTDVHFPVDLSIDSQLLEHYKNRRDIPSANGTSRFSMHLRFGTVSIRKLIPLAIQHSETWLNELIWREFYMMILFHFPHVATTCFKKNYEAITWRNNENEFEKWCEGKTGFPIVDAGMRELNTTGFMHNRVRMIVSSFLVKDLLIDWRWGEAYFANKLNDFDLSANNGGWQWAAGSGCDAAPYFRIFNPSEQQKRFDPDFKYIRKWIPEFETKAYPSPMLDHAAARRRTLEVYKQALTEKKQLNLF